MSNRCVLCPLEETIDYGAAAVPCDWVVTRSTTPVAGACGNTHPFLVEGLTEVPPGQDLTISVFAQGMTPEVCATMAGEFEIRPAGAGWPGGGVFTPSFTFGDCNLAEIDVSNWIRDLGADSAEVEFVVNAPVRLDLSSGVTCPPE